MRKKTISIERIIEEKLEKIFNELETKRMNFGYSEREFKKIIEEIIPRKFRLNSQEALILVEHFRPEFLNGKKRK